MTLEHEACFRKLQTLLAYHGKLVAENRDKGTMTRTEAEIRQVQAELERLNATPMSRTVIR